MTVRCPAVWDYLTLSTYDDGSDRVLSTIMVLVEHGQVKACLNDRENNRSLWVAGESLEGVLESLEALLDDDRAVWREYKPYGKPKGKGR